MRNQKRRTYQTGLTVCCPTLIPGHECPVPARLRNIGWGKFRRSVHATRQFSENPRAFAAWRRIMHDGWRVNDVCVWCGAQITVDEQHELDALRAAYPYWADV